MRVMVMVKANEDSEAGVMPSTELLTAMGKYNEELVKAGVMLAGEGLHPSSKGKRVRFSGTDRSVIDGPFAETKELIAGFWILQVKDMDEAVEWVKRCPNPMEGDSEIEIRRVFEAEDFGDAADARAARAGAAAARADRGAPIGGGAGDQPGDRGRLADRVRPVDRRPDQDRPRRRAGGGPRPGRAGRGARAVAADRRPRQPGRLADGRREVPGDRCDATRRRRSSASASRSAGSSTPRAEAPDLAAAHGRHVGDDLLGLVLMTCHPVLSTDARVALTLRLFGGLTTEEIARAFLVPEADGAAAGGARQADAGRGAGAVRDPPRRRAVGPAAGGARGRSTWCSTRATRRRPATTGCGRRCARTRCAWAACWPASCRASPRCTGWWR